MKFVDKNPQYETDLVEITTLVSEKATNGKTFVEIAQYYLVKGDKAKAIHYYLKAEARKLKTSGY
ncbi:hypothetical protein N7U66_13220 [Lacinutrix neustonica]|uniref:Uncharacterized protein n=1 Tax=Lacinutrix neustonica TaxID=2980107 RepID=A0A9E8MTG5_9FLAO|nr:hypothetical protein [Lacinutrix neustonica]WAC01118.1 hypothetical protein N7U66_13220 [Lacinutrix neustonica]